MIKRNKNVCERSLAEWLERASGTLGDVGRLDSEVDLLHEAIRRAETTERLEALLKRAESRHNEQVAVEAFKRLETIYTRMGEDEELARIHKGRLRFLRCGESAKPLVAGVMDEFTTNSFMPECKFLPLHPRRALEQLVEYRPEFVFIESAWHGNGGVWNKMVSTVSEPLRDLLEGCRDLGIPSVFWSKEDPVHFDTFLGAAAKCDYVFTTDIDCIPAYMEKLGHHRVFLLPFAAQTQTHNPIEIFERKDAFNFAGSYYLRYPERQRDTSNLIEAVSSLRPVEIYDRNYGWEHPHYRFPEEFAPMVLGGLPFSEIDRAYKGYAYGININTVKQSQTMFARRVYELMASNTVVVSNFSRGLRWMFGDLAVSSDNKHEIISRLGNVVENEFEYRKLRLRALRKVMREHTYTSRLEYIRSKIRGDRFREPEPNVALIASASAIDSLERLIAQFRNQEHSRKHLFLKATGFEIDQRHENISFFREDAELIAAFKSAQQEFDFFGEWFEGDFYGSMYLTDLTLAARFSDAEGFGKGCSFSFGANGPALECDGNQYSHVGGLPTRAMVMRTKHATEDRLRSILTSPGSTTVNELSLLALDEFNYCRDGAGNAIVTALCEDGQAGSEGSSISHVYEVAESLTPARRRLRGQAVSLPRIRARQFFDDAPVSKSYPLVKRLKGNALCVSQNSDGSRPAYLWMKTRLRRDDLNLRDQSSLSFDMTHDLLQAGFVCEFYTSSMVKISHSILSSGGDHALAIPAECEYLRLGVRLLGRGSLVIGDITFGNDKYVPEVVANTSRTLVLTKQYPSYDDLYRYGFLHSRIRGYRSVGRPVDIFRLNPNISKTFDEFENLDVATGDVDLLDRTLRTGRYAHVLVHMLDRSMWTILKRYLEDLKVTIWIHGAEIQHWRRRQYEFQDMSDADVQDRKRRADGYLRLWKEVFNEDAPNLGLVFVSDTLRREAFEDVGSSLAKSRYSVIHNYVDGGLFEYHQKTMQDRLKILSIRPYSSRTYANDLTISAIENLSRRDFFKELSFTLVGSGPLFAELTQRIAHHPNVRLVEKFLSQKEIGAYHRSHGVFICPTRSDSQGVSRDEAMASGLVPVTNYISAVPEFVDEGSGLLARPEDPAALADMIERLYRDPDLFLRLSEGAARRVRSQSGFQQTVARELELF